MSILIILAVLCRLTSAYGPSAAQPPVIFDSAFDALVTQLSELLHVPGISLAVVHKDTIASKGYGFSKLPNTAATPDSLYFTGSTTKAFVAAAAGIIVENTTTFPEVKWSTPLSHLLPGDFALHDDYYSSHITLEDALSHRSGLPRHDMAYGWNNASTIDVVRTMRHLPLTAEPRTRWQYCNIMFAAVGAVIERLTSNHLESVLRDWIWEPLGMRSTMFSLNAALRSKHSNGQDRLARGYFWNKDHYIPEPYMDLSSIAGAGATISSVNDYAQWAQALLNAGTNRSSPMNGSLYQTITTPRSIIDPSYFAGSSPPQPFPLLYALGWFVLTLGPHRIFAHGGSVVGFGADVYILPDEGFAFVSMANTEGTSNQLGALLFLEVLKKSGKLNASFQTNDTSWAYANDIGLPISGLRQSPTSKCEERTSGTSALPLPGRMDNYTGVYHNAGYGSINVSVDERAERTGGLGQAKTSGEQAALGADGSGKTKSLHLQPSQRTWPFALRLKHSSHTIFDAEILWTRGYDIDDTHVPVDCGNNTDPELRCKNEVYRQLIGYSQAVFDLDLKGEVAQVGVQLDGEMVRQAREEGEGDEADWRSGMIWFDKV